jgi:hypothetical protein
VNTRIHKPLLDDDGYPIPGHGVGYSMGITGVEKHGMTWDEYHTMLNAQQCCCAVCGAYEPLVIDHDHETGKIRGLLCQTCNVGIGMLGDCPLALNAASAYVGAAA